MQIFPSSFKPGAIQLKEADGQPMDNTNVDNQVRFFFFRELNHIYRMLVEQHPPFV